MKKYFNISKLSRETSLLFFFLFLFSLIVIRLFYLQIIKASYYEQILSNQHISKSLLKAERGGIYVNDKSNKPVKLTENIRMYNVFVEPQFVWDKARFIELITPIVYEHLCVVNGMKEVDKEGCIRNIEIFTNKELLPKPPQFFYYGSGIQTEGINTFDRTGFNQQKQSVISQFTTGTAYSLIQNKLDKRIYIGVNPLNYLGFFESKSFLEEVGKLPYIEIKYDNYVYIVPSKVKSPAQQSKELGLLLDKYGYVDMLNNLVKKFYPQENKYVKIISNVNSDIAQEVKDLKNLYYQERNKDNVPILHGLGLESYVTRYYTYGSFLANVLGYVDKNMVAYYGIEQYFDELLAGQDGEIKGRASAWIGQVGANEFEIKNVIDGDDVFLTIDMGMQREIEMIAERFNKYLKSDSVSILVYNPYNGHVKASVNYPTYDPNNYNDAYKYMPLSPEYGYLIDDETYVDVPVYYRTGGEMKLATTLDRINTGLQKYIKKNIYGSQVFVDKNISMAYEPGSIFKAFTVGIALDVDEISLYDFYNDPGSVKVGPYTIKNADMKHCVGDHTFLNALVNSCNIGMVRIAQRIGKEIFYNYLEKLGFGSLTDIELANEDPGNVWSVASTSKARFFNNTFGQGLEVTPIQIAAGYGTLVNGGYYVKPTIVAGIRDKQTGIYKENPPKVVRQVFKESTAENMKEGLFQVMENNGTYIKLIRIDGYTLGGKSGTSQISYKGKYQKGRGWTNGSFVGLVTKDNVRYVVVIQVRRPRLSERGGETAGRIFRDVASFLIRYSLIEK